MERFLNNPKRLADGKNLRTAKKPRRFSSLMSSKEEELQIAEAIKRSLTDSTSEIMPSPVESNPDSTSNQTSHSCLFLSSRPNDKEQINLPVSNPSTSNPNPSPNKCKGVRTDVNDVSSRRGRRSRLQLRYRPQARSWKGVSSLKRTTELLADCQESEPEPLVKKAEEPDAEVKEVTPGPEPVAEEAEDPVEEVKDATPEPELVAEKAEEDETPQIGSLSNCPLELSQTDSNQDFLPPSYGSMFETFSFRGGAASSASRKLTSRVGNLLGTKVIAVTDKASIRRARVREDFEGVRGRTSDNTTFNRRELVCKWSRLPFLRLVPTQRVSDQNGTDAFMASAPPPPHAKSRVVVGTLASAVNICPETRRFHLLVAVLLSSRTQFSVVLEAHKALQRELLRETAGGLVPQVIAAMEEKRLAGIIRRIHFNNAKAKHLVQASKIIANDYGGCVPQGRKEVLGLPGIGAALAEVLSVLFT